MPIAGNVVGNDYRTVLLLATVRVLIDECSIGSNVVRRYRNAEQIGKTKFNGNSSSNSNWRLQYSLKTPSHTVGISKIKPTKNLIKTSKTKDNIGTSATSTACQSTIHWSSSTLLATYPKRVEHAVKNLAPALIRLAYSVNFPSHTSREATLLHSRINNRTSHNHSSFAWACKLITIRLRRERHHAVRRWCPCRWGEWSRSYACFPVGKTAAGLHAARIPCRFCQRPEPAQITGFTCLREGASLNAWSHAIVVYSCDNLCRYHSWTFATCTPNRDPFSCAGYWHTTCTAGCWLRDNVVGAALILALEAVHRLQRDNRLKTRHLDLKARTACFKGAWGSTMGRGNKEDGKENKEDVHFGYESGCWYQSMPWMTFVVEGLNIRIEVGKVMKRGGLSMSVSIRRDGKAMKGFTKHCSSRFNGVYPQRNRCSGPPVGRIAEMARWWQDSSNEECGTKVLACDTSLARDTEGDSILSTMTYWEGVLCVHIRST